MEKISQTLAGRTAVLRILVEVKSGLTVAADSVDGLRWWTALPGNRDKRGILVHGGDSALSLHGFTVLPWFLK